jgi:hypothetical protein
MYGVLPYFLAKDIIEIPIITIVPLLFSLIVYFGIGLSKTFH